MDSLNMSLVASELEAIAQYELDLALAEKMQLREVINASLGRRVPDISVEPSLATAYAEQAQEMKSLGLSEDLKSSILVANEQLEKDYELAMKLQRMDERGYDVDEVSDENHSETEDTGSEYTSDYEQELEEFIEHRLTAKGKSKSTSFGSWNETHHIPAEDNNYDDNNYNFRDYLRYAAQFTCGICFDEFVLIKPMQNEASSSKRATLQGALIPGCQHLFCTKCLARFLTMELKKPGTNFPIRCPGENCHCNIEDTIAQRVLTVEELEFWWQKKAESSMTNKIYCPNKKCSIAMDFKDPDSYAGLSLKCPVCNQFFCGTCLVSWHMNMTCEQYQALPLGLRYPEDRKILETAADQNWKRCPKCRAMVELQSGCNHITCLCRAEFCYKCGSEWDTINQECSSGDCELWDEEYLLDEQERERERERERLIEDDAQPRIGHRGLDFDLIRRMPACRISSWLTTMMDSTQCGYCNREFTTLAGLESHLNTTTRHTVYHCCGKIFPNENAYQQHQQSLGCRL